jgi:UDP-N-acetylmuramoyl-tripeptide--D-alanyl-D-alanine ligase
MRAESGPYRTRDILRASRGVLLCGDAETAFEAISTDSRDIKRNDLFVPLKGANFDGHSFLLPALEAGARGSLVDRDIDRDILPSLSNHVLIQVQDTLHAISDLASAHRIHYPIPLIAVTGSSGKTTVKEMIAAVLRRSHHPLVSEANLNNVIGLPMTVLTLRPDHTVAVVEAGINQPGEMDLLASAASPDIAVITTVGPVHLEGLTSVENVAREKFKLVRAVSPRGTAVLPAENEHLKPLFKEALCRVITFGVDQGDFKASDVRIGAETVFRMITPFGEQQTRLRIRGRHNVSNALAAAAASLSVGATLDQVSGALEEFQPLSGRMEVLDLSGNRILIRDCYNANPQSVKAALEVLVQTAVGRGALAILADMKELGVQSEELHAQMGREAARLGIERVVFVGDCGRAFSGGFTSEGGDPRALTTAPDKEAAWSAVASDLRSFGAILVKGSRAMKMETIVDRILEEEN